MTLADVLCVDSGLDLISWSSQRFEGDGGGYGLRALNPVIANPVVRISVFAPSSPPHGPMGPWAHGPMGPWPHGPMAPWAHGPHGPHGPIRQDKSSILRQDKYPTDKTNTQPRQDKYPTATRQAPSRDKTSTQPPQNVFLIEDFT